MLLSLLLPVLLQWSLTCGANDPPIFPFKSYSKPVPVHTTNTVKPLNFVTRGTNITKIPINPSKNIFIQSDKPIYKPGQTLKFRILSLDSNLLPHNRVFRTVELQDPYSNRIGQWLNQTTRIGILDLSHSMSPEAAHGYYTITAWDDKKQQISQRFEIKEYVLPKFEVDIDFPPIISAKDKEVTLKVCGIYTYGKPVLGSVNAKVCVQSYDYKPGFPNKLDACKEYSTKTDKTGCWSQVINVSKFSLSTGESFQVNCKVEESGTGIIMQGSTSAVFIRDYVRVLFEDTDTYRPGMNFEGKANQKGGKKQPNFEARERERPFHSQGNSFLTLIYAPENPSSSNEITVMVKYTIDARALNLDKTTLDFCYIVLSQSRMHQNGRLSVSVSTRNGAVITGELRFTLNCQHTLVPFAHVVVFTVLPSGEPVTGSILISIQNVLPEVSIVCSSSKVEPGETISFTLKAKPGSLCSVRAIDQSVMLLRPEAELDVFTGTGIQIANTDVKTPDVYDIYQNTSKLESAEYDFDQLRKPMVLPGLKQGSDLEAQKPTQEIRKSFPETWIWDLIPVGKSGSVKVEKMVPDTVTKWAVGAFCTSQAGFKVAPKTDLIAFKPFFVSLTLPYSVIYEEMFTLKATVFNYLPKCIMVKVSLANSLHFTAQSCKGCTYTQCVCSEKSQTFQWIVTASELGKVNIKVHAEAVQSQGLCGNKVVTLPDKGRVDTVTQSVLVQMPSKIKRH